MSRSLGSAHVVHGDARHLDTLAADSVDLIVTSPPYFALRSYQDAGQHYEGQLGSEATPAAFVDALLEVTAECMRVLKPSGSLWVNLGDKYATTCPPGSGGKGAASKIQQTHPGSYTPEQPSYRRPDNGNIRPKSLIGIPWRYALACIDQLGLILRAEIIWNKPNGLPESVTDRVRRSHEQWFHFTLQPRYFSAVDEIREPQQFPNHGQLGKDPRGQKWIDTPGGHAEERHHVGRPETRTLHPLGKLPGSVWTIPTEPLQVPPHLGIDHFAAYPTEWPRRIIQGWTPTGVCVECGEGRRPVVDAEYESQGSRRSGYARDLARPDGDPSGMHGKPLLLRTTTITGYACACPTPDAPTQPAIVLDPFGGTGTTALVAKALGRHGITVDMSADYCRLAEWRVNDRDQLAKALGLPRIGPPDTDQMTLFP